MAGERSSSEADRKLEGGTAKIATEAANSSGDGSLHPAFYIAYADHRRATRTWATHRTPG